VLSKTGDHSSAQNERRVVVMGQGYVGLPLAMRAVEAGFDVVGFDTDVQRVHHLQHGESFIGDVTDSELKRALGTGRYLATVDPNHLENFDVAVISVPTPLRDGAPDLTAIESAARSLAPALTAGCCVVLESTTYPGTTEELLVPALEAGSALRAGTDFHVGYSPERIDPGNPQWTFRTTPKIIAGINESSLKEVDRFFSCLVDQTVAVNTVKEAELAKLLENTFRHVNIALVNELAMYAHDVGIDVWSVIDAAATKPFGYMKFMPGPGVGGHCLPIDPSYLSWQVRRSAGRAFRFVELANDVNEHMPEYVVGRAAGALNRRAIAVNGATVLLFGLTYKQNTADARESPAIAVALQLARMGARLRAVDPLVDPAHVPQEIELVAFSADELANCDLAIVLTDHDEIDWSTVERFADKVLDTRHRLGGERVERL
jgi:UDP-N-acetyl-D-mannosaminuronic acid dehydrogenase/UDP-N-acetyl-D-glucosamine dehydrogenase